MYKILNDKIVSLKDIGETTSVATEELNEKGEPIMVETHYPIYEKEFEFPIEEFVNNLTHDLTRIKDELDVKLIESNAKVAEIKAVKTDCEELNLPGVKESVINEVDEETPIIVK